MCNAKRQWQQEQKKKINRSKGTLKRATKNGIAAKRVE